MTEPDPTTPAAFDEDSRVTQATPTWLKRVRLVRRIGYVIALFFIVPYVYERWTTPPAAGPVEDSASLASEEVTMQLVRLFAMPPIQMVRKGWRGPPTLEEPPETSAFIGRWQPDQDTVQANALSQYTTAEVADYAATADKIIRTLPENASPRRLNLNEYRWGWWGGDFDELLPHQLPLRYYLFSARDRIEGNSDNYGFLDLVSAVRFGRAVDQFLPYSHGYQQNESHALSELSFHLFDATLPREIAKKIIDVIAANNGLSLSGELQHTFVDASSAAILDRYYTNDKNGDGELVLSVCGDVLGMSYYDIVYRNKTESNLRNRAWNLFAPLFYSRTDVLARLGGDRADWIAAADEIPFHQLREKREFKSENIVRSVRDGPFLFSRHDLSLHVQDFHTPAVVIAQRRGVVILTALAAYRYDHGEYPAKLQELIPAYLDKVPLELFSAKPFFYDRRTSSDFELRKVDDSGESIDFNIEFLNAPYVIHPGNVPMLFNENYRRPRPTRSDILKQWSAKTNIDIPDEASE